MSVLSSWIQSSLFIGAFLTALAGSVHCFGMCGGIASLAGRSRVLAYQGGRLLGYLALGGLFGAFGKGLYRFLERYPEGLIALQITFFVLIFWQAWSWWRGRGEKTFLIRLQAKTLRFGFARVSRLLGRQGGAFGLGLGTALLPCAWIASFGVLAAATGSAFSGAGVFLALWSGSLPALLAVAVGAQVLQGKFSTLAWRRVLAVSLAVMAVLSYAHRMDVAQAMLHGAGSGEVNLICH